jgi:alkyl hydroperoxide reductase subunit AhpF
MALEASERAQIRQQFEAIEGPLKLEYYHQSPRRVMIPGRPDRPSCQLARELYEEIADLSDHISLTIYEHEDSHDQVKRRDIVDVPCVLIRGELNRPLRFYGAPNGHLLVAMIRAMVLASTRQSKPSARMKRILSKLRRPTRLRLLGSTHDPMAGQAALAACAATLLSPKLQTDVFAIEEFAEIGARSGVTALPALFIDDRLFAAGLVEPLDMVEFIGLWQANPEKAQLNPPIAQPGSATAWRPPQPPTQQREPVSIDPIAAAAGRAREAAATPEGMRRTSGGLIVPNR